MEFSITIYRLSISFHRLRLDYIRTNDIHIHHRCAVYINISKFFVRHHQIFSKFQWRKNVVWNFIMLNHSRGLPNDFHWIIMRRNNNHVKGYPLTEIYNSKYRIQLTLLPKVVQIILHEVWINSVWRFVRNVITLSSLLFIESKNSFGQTRLVSKLKWDI